MTGYDPDGYSVEIFKDGNANFAFLTQSSVECDNTIKWTDGNEYPLYKLDIARNGCSSRWLYDPAGLIQVLAIHKSHVYMMPSVTSFNALLAVPSRTDQPR